MKMSGKKVSPSLLIILVFLIAIPAMNFNHKYYLKSEGVIIWDVKSYYAYLPSAFIYKDLSLDYITTDTKKFNKWVWPIITPTGKKAILTTMGLSVLYSPFFFVAHGYTLLDKTYEPDGYSLPYQFALTFSSYVYFLLALIILRKLLLKFFSELSTAITLLALGAGTNLLYYVTYEAPMSHAYNFFLIILFLYLLVRWYDKFSWKSSILLGLTAGMISLIRPTNTIVLLFIPLLHIQSIRSIKTNAIELMKKWPKLFCMAIAFTLVWIPQFLYWHKVAGKFFYFSYGEVGSKFYFLNPHIIDVLFSYKKGLFVYTPVMLLATIGMYFLMKRKGPFSLAVIVYFLVNLYILSSWWSWWFGGGFSNRAFIDGYGIMAFPLAAFLDYYKKISFKKVALLILVVLLTALNIFQVQQYRYGSIHWNWMNKEAYWESFLRLRPSCKFWNILNQPNYEKARKGIYEPTFFIDSFVSREDLFKKISNEVEKDSLLLDSLSMAAMKNIPIEKQKVTYINSIIDQGLAKREYKDLRMEFLKGQMRNCPEWKKEIEKKSKRKGITFDQMSTIEADRIFEKYSQKYIAESY